MAEVDPQKTFNVEDAATHLSTLMDRARAGEEIVLAKAGAPWAKLGPLEPSSSPLPARAPRKPGRYRGELSGIPDSVWFDPLPEDELDAWEGKYSNIV